MLRPETIDAIAIDSMMQHRDMILDDLIAYEDKTAYVHDEDYVRCTRLIVDFNRVLDYYGVSEKGTNQRRKELENERV
jgi:hypothetical protein